MADGHVSVFEFEIGNQDFQLINLEITSMSYVKRDWPGIIVDEGLICDHHHISCNLFRPKPHLTTETITYRKIKEMDKTSFNAELSLSPIGHTKSKIGMVM